MAKKKVMKKVKRYKRLEITRDCLVPKGAMEVKSVFKDDGHFIKVLEPVFKFDDNKQMMYNVMVKFGKPDSQNMILDDEKVRTDTMINYIATGDKILKFTHKKDEDEEPYDIDAHVAEVYFAKENDPYYPEEEGAIIRGAYFSNKEEYDIVKELKFESSVEGTADLEVVEIEVEVDVPDDEDEVVKSKKHKIKDLLKKIFNIDVNKDSDSVMEDKKNTNLWYPIEALQTAIWDSEWKLLWSKDKNVKKFKKEVKKICNQFVKYVDGMTFEKIKKEGENKQEGDGMVEEKDVKKVVNDMFGLEEGQTVSDLIVKTVNDAVGKLPPKPTVIKSKDEDGKETEIDLVNFVKSIAVSVKALSESEVIKKSALEKKFEEAQKTFEDLKKQLTENAEISNDGTKDDPIVKSADEKTASIVC